MKKLLFITITFVLFAACKKEDSPKTDETPVQYAPDNTMVINGKTYNLTQVTNYLYTSGGFYVDAQHHLVVQDSSGDSTTYDGFFGLSFPRHTTVPKIKNYTLSDSLAYIHLSWTELKNGSVHYSYGKVEKGTISIVLENGVRKYKGVNLVMTRPIGMDPLKQERLSLSFTVVTR